MAKAKKKTALLVYQRFDHIFYTIMYRIMWATGFEFMVPTYKFNVRSAITFFLVYFSFIPIVYTFVYFDRETRMKTSTLTATGLQGVAKTIVYYLSASTMRSFVEQNRKIYVQCDRQHDEARILSGWLNKMEMLMKLFIASIFCAATPFVLLPLAVYLITGETVELLPFQVPLMDLATRSGYTGQTLFHIAVVIVTAGGLMGADLTMCLLIVLVGPMADLILLKLRVLDQYLRADAGQARRRTTRDYLHNIILMHIEFDLYLRRLSELYYELFIGEVLLNGISMCLIIFVNLQFTWYPLYMFFMMMMLKTFVVCAFGTLAEYLTDRTQDAFEAFPYYRLCVGDQKKFVMLLQRAQNPTVLMCGTVRLNMELFVSVIKNTYTVAMLLQSFED